MTSQEYSKRLENIEVSLDRVFPARPTIGWGREVAGQNELPLTEESLVRINAPAWELLRRGGKRWRPLVMTLSHELFGGTLDEIDDWSCLVELPHNGSLIVDDIEDKAEERRGGPAIHLMYGVDMAINTGNFLYFEPTFLVDRSALDEATKYRVLKYYLRVMRRLHFGQGLDIQWHNDHDFLPTREQYLQMCRFKTGALSRLAAELGAVSAGADDAAIEGIGTLWEEIGVGFQILDDVKNLVRGNPGKMRGDDIVEGKKSLPVLCHAQMSPDRGESLRDVFKLVQERHAQRQSVVELVESAIQTMQASGAIDEAAKQGDRMLSENLELLKRSYPDHPARRGMQFLVETFHEGLKS